jgi:chromosome segregation ATPase
MHSESTLVLDVRVDELQLEIDSLKSSRNYYKDQLESLLPSLADGAHREGRASRTQEEVDEIVESIQLQEEVKRKDLKRSMMTVRAEYESKIGRLEAKIAHQETLLHEQEEVRVSLLEKLMDSKRQLANSTSLQHETELSLTNLQNAQISLIAERNEHIASTNPRVIEGWKRSHAEKVQTLELHIRKISHKWKEATDSLQIYQAAQREANSQLTELKSQLSSQKQTELQLRSELNIERKKVTDCSEVIQAITGELRQLQDEMHSSRMTIQRQSQELVDKISESDKTNARLILAIDDADRLRSQLRDAVREGVDLRVRVEQLEMDRSRYRSRSDERSTALERQFQEMKSRNEELQSQLDELRLLIREHRKSSERMQTQVGQEIRLRREAEYARDAALKNLQKAYELVNVNQYDRHMTNLEIERIRAENWTSHSSSEEHTTFVRSSHSHSGSQSLSPSEIPPGAARKSVLADSLALLELLSSS